MTFSGTVHWSMHDFLLVFYYACGPIKLQQLRAIMFEFCCRILTGKI